MAGDDERSFGEDHEAVLDGADEDPCVAAGEVGSSDAAGEEGVSGQKQIFGGEIEAKASWSVAGGMDDRA